MKIRNGFVSNSSSSNFIVAFKRGEVCEHCGRGDPWLLDLFEVLKGEDKEWGFDGISIMGGKKVIKYLLPYRGGRVEFINFYKLAIKVMRATMNGYNVAVLNAPQNSHGEYLIKTSKNMYVINEENL